METVFSLSSLLVMPFWLLMILLPHWRFTRRVMHSPLMILPPALLYAALVLPRLGGLLETLSDPTLAVISASLGTPEGAMVAWAHFLTFDLFVGRWAYLDSRERSISAWLMAPVLFFILMLGPLGFILYLILRAAHAAVRRRASVAGPA